MGNPEQELHEDSLTIQSDPVFPTPEFLETNAIGLTAENRELGRTIAREAAIAAIEELRESKAYRINHYTADFLNTRTNT